MAESVENIAMEAAALKPCPFCGAHLVAAKSLATPTAIPFTHPRHKGEELYCAAEGIIVWADSAEWVAAWNRRALEGARMREDGWQPIPDEDEDGQEPTP